MEPRLIFVTGAPAAGKTAVCRILFKRLANAAWLDGDDVWRINPFRVDAQTTALAEGNIQSVLRNYLSSGFEHALLSWVLHEQSIIDRILRGLDGIAFQFYAFTLVCEEATLAERFAEDPARGQVSSLALQRLRESKALATIHVETDGLEPRQVARKIEAILAERKGIPWPSTSES